MEELLTMKKKWIKLVSDLHKLIKNCEYFVHFLLLLHYYISRYRVLSARFVVFRGVMKELLTKCFKFKEGFEFLANHITCSNKKSTMKSIFFWHNTKTEIFMSRAVFTSSKFLDRRSSYWAIKSTGIDWIF